MAFFIDKSQQKKLNLHLMNTTGLILEFLKKHGSVAVPGFGVFYLKNSGAKIDAESNSILPPVKEIAFNIDYETKTGNFLDFVADEEKISATEAQFQLIKATNYWKKSLIENNEVQLGELGVLHQTETGTHFKGKTVLNADPDFYGLEEINISKLKKSVPSENNAQDYRFSKSILWIFLLIIPVLGILFLAFTKRELLFGKKSFEPTPVQTSTRRIETDSVAIKKAAADSLKIDSLKQDSIQKATVLPVKKWSNTSKYKKNTWRKPKKRANRSR